MTKLLASALCVALAMSVSSINLIAAGRMAVQTGTVAGIATVDGKALGNVQVRLRNVDTGQLVGNTTANASGQFSFAGLPPGNFVVETVASNGTILGTSTPIALTATTMVVASVTVGTSAAAVAAAGGVGAAAAGAGVAAGTGLSATAITLIAIGGGLAATGLVVAATGGGSTAPTATTFVATGS